MKTMYLIIPALVYLLFVNVSVTEAQILKRLQNKIEEKVEDKVGDLLEDSSAKQGGASTAVYSFIPGGQVIFQDDMSADALGRMPKNWKTHSTGMVSQVNGVSGKWLKMSDRSSYQLDTLLNLPDTFTVEFDLLTRADQASDLRDVHFGFSKSNNPKNYIYGVSADNTVVSTFLQFYYNSIRTSSNDTDLENTLDFALDNLGNSIIPIAIEVNGTNMRVFVNKRNVLDAEVLTLDSPKHFYISNEDPKNGAQVYLGNFRIAK